MINKSFKLFLIVTLFTSCRQNQKGTNSMVRNNTINLYGYWILTNYIDKILETNSIEPQRHQGLAWKAIILKLGNDSIETHGLMMKEKFPISQNVDSLTIMDNYKLTYNSINNTIKAQDIKNKDTVQYIFRKTNQDEERLVANIDGKSFYQQLEDNFYNFYIDKIISGTYQPLIKSKGLKTLKLLADGTMTGFKKFDTYYIHDFFGTLHPFLNDAIIFTDTNKVVIENERPNNYTAYKWEFKGDTLLLTEYITDNDETYSLGLKQYKLLKQNKHSKYID